MITNTDNVEQPAFYLVGISARTINPDGQSQKDIGDLWTKFMNEGVLQQIANRA